MSKSVFILGLGFLGQALYTALAQQGWSVAGSRRQSGDAGERLMKQVALNIDEETPTPEALTLLLAADALVCLLPPSSSVDYAAQVMRLVHLMQQQGRLQQVILASSTSVYGDEIRVCSETTPVSPQTASANAIVALEQALNESAVAQVSILRFGGLFGPSRHPVTVLAKKPLIQGTHQPVNMVSQTDAVAAIVQLLAQPLASRQLYNVCHPEHPSKQVFYQGEADRRGLGVLSFDWADERTGKIIDGQAYLKDYRLVMADLI